MPPRRNASAILIEALHGRAGQRVVVLVDEYDKPILDALTVRRRSRVPTATICGGVYSTIKDRDAHIRFTFLTGVSKFSKVSLFSGLNNLQDVTLDPRYSTVCGYTDADLDTVFAAELPGLDRTEIRDWYNGYNWRGEERVYNPFDILLLFERREFGAWWFETGTPKFLIDTLMARGRKDRWTWTACSAATSCCRRSTSTTWRPRPCCSRPATSPSAAPSPGADSCSTAWATRTARCARASTTGCCAA